MAQLNVIVHGTIALIQEKDAAGNLAGIRAVLPNLDKESGGGMNECIAGAFLSETMLASGEHVLTTGVAGTASLISPIPYHSTDMSNAVTWLKLPQPTKITGLRRLDLEVGVDVTIAHGPPIPGGILYIVPVCVLTYAGVDLSKVTLSNHEWAPDATAAFANLHVFCDMDMEMPPDTDMQPLYRRASDMMLWNGKPMDITYSNPSGVAMPNVSPLPAHLQAFVKPVETVHLAKRILLRAKYPHKNLLTLTVAECNQSLSMTEGQMTMAGAINCTGPGGSGGGGGGGTGG